MLDHVLAAVADPTRRAIIDRLARGEARVTDVAAPFAMSLNAVSKHIKVLEQAGLVRRTRTGREHTLVLDARPLREVARWASHYERYWNERLDRLETFFKKGAIKMKTIDISVSRVIPASPNAVYAVWLDASSPGGPWFGAKRVILDAKVDGLFFHAVGHAGRDWAHYGRFVKLDRPHTIEHTWMSEATKGIESVVTVTLAEKPNGTEVTIKHTGIPDDELGRSHEGGWSSMLGVIAERFATK